MVNIHYHNETLELVEQYLANKEPVIIHYNQETGDWLYSISVVNDPGFWLDAFKTKKAAETFCKKHNLSIVNFIKDHKDD